MNNMLNKIVLMINNPTDLLNDQNKQKELITILNDLAKSQAETRLVYDGDAMCALSGELVKDQPTYEIDDVRILKSALQHKVLNYGVPGILDESLNYIEFHVYQNGTLVLKQLKLAEPMLSELFGGDRLRELRVECAKYFEQQLMNKANYTYTCPITRKSGYTQQDGIRVQNQVYSIEGAKQLLIDSPDSFQPHQKEYLRQMIEQQQNR